MYSLFVVFCQIFQTIRETILKDITALGKEAGLHSFEQVRLPVHHENCDAIYVCVCVCVCVGQGSSVTP